MSTVTVPAALLWLGAALILGAALGWLVARAMEPIFSHPTFERQNYRGHTLPTAVGMVLPIALLAATMVALALDISPLGAHVRQELSAWEPFSIGLIAVPVWAFATLGLLDDLVGAGESGGFRGHLRALARGRLTSGGLKLLGGAAVGMLLGWVFTPQGLPTVFAIGVTTALWANVGNLFDRAPGRASKTMIAATLVVAAFAVWGPWHSPRFEVEEELLALQPVAVLLGAACALMVGDLRERFMLGDAGSNVLGFMVAFTAVTSFSLTGILVLGAIGLALNVASEFVSFSRIIDSVPPLRALDRLGAPHRS